jgi:colanic acid biosynthesis glycosyl transferase WcaI
MDRKTGKASRRENPSIVITTQVYPPEVQATAVMVRELAGYLAASGWDVTVCAGLPHHPHGRLYDGWRWRLWQESHENGFRVLRVGHLVHPSRSIPVRAAIYVSQALSTFLAALSSKKCDIVLAYGPPLAGPNLAALAARRHSAKLANVIYDIYPDIAIETGRVKNPLVIAAARVAEKVQYAASDLTIVLSEGFKKQLVAKGVPADKIAVIPVWLDPDEIKPMDRDNAWRREQGIPLDKFVVLYAGTIGIISGASMVADAAALLRHRKDILFLFVGEGEEKPKVMARARELGLKNMMFLPYQPRERLSEVQATADIGIVTLLPGRGRTSVPSKVLGYMAAGRPVVASVDIDSDTAEDIRRAGAGMIVEPANPTALVDAIVNAFDNYTWRNEAGKSARKYFVIAYGKNNVLERYMRILEASIK